MTAIERPSDEVVMEVVRQYKTITDDEWNQAGGFEGNLREATGKTWTFTAELRRKDDEDE